MNWNIKIETTPGYSNDQQHKREQHCFTVPARSFDDASMVARLLADGLVKRPKAAAAYVLAVEAAT